MTTSEAVTERFGFVEVRDTNPGKHAAQRGALEKDCSNDEQQ